MRKQYINFISLFFVLSCGNNEELTLDCNLSPIVLKVTNVIDTGCGENTGELHLEVTGGNDGFLYSLDEINYQTETVFTNLSAGLYTVFVKDKGGCSNQTNATVMDTGTVEITSVESQNTDCGTSNGSVTITASGGDGNFSYNLNGGAEQPESVFSQLSSGTYVLTVTDGTSCMAVSTVTILENNGIVIDDISQSDAGCGTSVGGITITSSGGDGNFSYSIDGSNFQSSNSFTDLGSGNHTITIQDGSGCTTTTDVNVLTGVSFANDVKLIIDTNCAISGCHVAQGGRKDFTKLSEIQANAAEIKTRVISGSMPKNGTLTSQEKNLIVCWIEDGALNN